MRDMAYNTFLLLALAVTPCDCSTESAYITRFEHSGFLYHMQDAVKLVANAIYPAAAAVTHSVAVGSLAEEET